MSRESFQGKIGFIIGGKGYAVEGQSCWSRLTSAWFMVGNMLFRLINLVVLVFQSE